jgi:hypothetical protein
MELVQFANNRCANFSTSNLTVDGLSSELPAVIPRDIQTPQPVRFWMILP